MARALIAVVVFSVLAFGVPAHAQDSSITLTLIRAVRVSNTSVTLSYKTSVSSIGKVAYTAADNSKFTLTDSVPQTDHLFTIDQLNPRHGYSFVLSASADHLQSNTYSVLLSPDSVGVPGASLMPSVAQTDASGTIVSTTLAATTTPAPIKPLAPWWAFVLLFILVVGGWIGYGMYQRTHSPVPPAY